MYHNSKTISQNYKFESNTSTLTNQYGLPPYKHEMELIVKVATSSTDTHASLIQAIHDELMEYINFIDKIKKTFSLNRMHTEMIWLN